MQKALTRHYLNLPFGKTTLASALILAFGSGAGQAAPEDSANLETITVGAESFAASSVGVGNFRDQSVLDTPLISNVITREVLDAQGAQTVYDALRNTAGVTRHQISGSVYDNLAIRGILVENRGNYRLNGALPIINLVAIPLENKQQVEVLKGASSFYYGMIPPSGVVNFVTKRPENTPITSLSTSANQHGALGVHADIGRRFGENDAFGIRLNAAVGKDDIGIDRYEADRSLLSAAFDWKVVKDFKLTADIEHYKKDATEQPPIAVPAAVGGVITLPAVPSNTQNLGSEWMKTRAEATNYLLRGDLNLGTDWIATLETGRAETKRDRNLGEFYFSNVATGAGNLRFFQTLDQEYTNTYHRAELFGQIDTGVLHHELTFGVTQNKREQDPGRDGPRGGSSITRAQNFYNPTEIAEFSTVYASKHGARSVIDDRGIYVLDRISFGDQWQVIGGLRWSDFESSTDGLPANAITAQKTTPNVSLIYKLTANLSAYATYLEGLEVTRPVPSTASNAGEILPPSLSKQKEIGIKWRVMPSLLTQAAIFEYTGLPSTGFVAGAGSRFDILGNSRIRGLELSGTGEIGREWAITASAVLLDAEIQNALNLAEVGKTPNGVPDATASLFAEYRLSEVPGLAFNAGTYFTGKRYVNNLNQAAVDGYSLATVGARYVHKMGGTRLIWQLNIDNLFDKDYWGAASGGYLSSGTPRTAMLTLKADF